MHQPSSSPSPSSPSQSSSSSSSSSSYYYYYHYHYYYYHHYYYYYHYYYHYHKYIKKTLISIDVFILNMLPKNSREIRYNRGWYQYIFRDTTVYHTNVSLYIALKQDKQTGTISAAVMAIPVQFISSNSINITKQINWVGVLTQTAHYKHSAQWSLNEKTGNVLHSTQWGLNKWLPLYTFNTRRPVTPFIDID